jgi:rare lipoprotein A
LSEIARHRSGDYLERSERPRITEERTRPRRTRVARATISDEEDYDERPRRRIYRGQVEREFDEERPRRATRRATTRRHTTQIRRAPRVAHHHAPAWTRRSLTSGGPRGSGQSGIASYYWEPQRLASGGWFNPNAMTAAHRSLPFGTRVRVTHSRTGRHVDVTINDRGPYVGGRVIDLSRAAAKALGMTAQGLAQVKVMVLGR